MSESKVIPAAARVTDESSLHSVHLDYPGGGTDDLEWQLFTRSQMVSLAHSAGLVLIAACTDFDLMAEPCPSNPRIQFVLE